MCIYVMGVDGEGLIEYLLSKCNVGMRMEQGSQHVRDQMTSLQKVISQLIHKGDLQEEAAEELQKSSSRISEALEQLGSRAGENEFFPEILFALGPTTTNVVLSFFLSNPDNKFTREEVYDSLQRHVREKRLNQFFIHIVGYDFGGSSNSENNSSRSGGFKIGRNTVFRVVANLCQLESLNKKNVGRDRHQYFINQEHWRYRSIKQIVEDFKNSDNKLREKYSEFMESDHGSTIDDVPSTHFVEDIEQNVQTYIKDLKKWGPFHYDFLNKHDRIFAYCNHYGSKQSTVRRNWNKHESNILSNMNPKTLRTICNKINPNFKKKTGEDDESFRERMEWTAIRA